jgi:signal transduction histidine kinase
VRGRRDDDHHDALITLHHDAEPTYYTNAPPGPPLRVRPGGERDHAMELTIARCRIVLSLAALVAVYVDPTAPTLLPALNQAGGSFSIDPYALGVLVVYLVTAVAVYVALVTGVVSAGTVGAVTTWTDVLFAGTIAAFTEGISSPFYAFFAFAVCASGFRAGLRPTMAVVVVAIGLYMSLILITGDGINVYVMRPVYLAIVGYLIAYLGERRLQLERQLRRLEAQRERGRIASALHDGSVQALVAVGLRLEGCRDLLASGRSAEALADLSRLQHEIEREHAELRAYARDLARIEDGAAHLVPATDLRVSLDLRFTAPARVVDEVLQITREAVANARRHAAARVASVVVTPQADQLVLTIDDDGIGFPVGAEPPWSIAARVRAAGGDIRLERAVPGAHLRGALQTASVPA